jgi:hypothetical protein
MATPTNILQTVQTYQRSGLAFLENLNCLIADVVNSKFKDFENFTANLGSSVSFDIPPRAVTNQGLVATFNPAVQLIKTLSVTQAVNSSIAFTAQERIFNVEKEGDEYINIFGEANIKEIANTIEIDLANQAQSGVVYQSGPNAGQMQTDSGPFRFFGNGTTPINSYQQLAQMITNFKNWGSVTHGIKVILPDTAVPAIVGSGLNEFALKRNDDIAMSWFVGDFGFPPVKYYQSNLLPVHTSGTVGNGASTLGGGKLTVVSTNDPTGANITQITFSGATANDANAIFSGDMAQIVFGVSGQPNVYFNTYIGSAISGSPVQIRAVGNAGANSSGQVTVTLSSPLTTSPVQRLNGAIQISTNIVAGMQFQFLPTHQCGLVVGGDAFYLAMPRLPDQAPYYTAAEYDESTGVSMRLTYGSQFGQNSTGWIYDAVWGSHLVSEFCMRIAFPLAS